MIEKKEPLPINYYTIFEALENILPDHCMIILKAIKKIVLITNEMPGFMTLGIDPSGRLIIYEKFWNEHVTSQDALQTLLYHELLHFIAGDVYTIRPNPDKDQDITLQNIADNIAMDSRINAFINRTRQDIDSTEFLEGFYNDKRCAEEPLHKLLRPNSVFTKEESALKEEYDLFYDSDELSSHHKLSALVYEELKKRNSGKDKAKKIIIKLLGGHAEGGEGGEQPSEEDLKDAEVIEIDLRDLDAAKRKKLQEAQQKSDTTRGQEKIQEIDERPQQTSKENIKEAIIDHLAGISAGSGSTLVTQLLDQCLGLTEKLDLNKFKKMAFDNIFHNVRSQARQKVGKYVSAPYIPKRISTTDSILLAAKVPVLLYKHQKYAYKTDKNLLPIYLDVSGSTMPYLPEIIKLIANVSDQLDYVWGFSTKIVKHTTQQLADGKIDTTGGTDFTCVIDHAVENKFKHIVVITDGEGYAQKYDGSKVSSIDSVVTILFGSAWKENYFTKHYESTHMIDEVKI